MARRLALCGLLLGCAQPNAAPKAISSERTPDLSAEARTPAAVEVEALRDDTPAGGDGAPRFTLTFRFEDGSRERIEGEATAYVPFRHGVALVDAQRRLVLVSPGGARSLLARETSAPPARGPSGELAYVTRHELEVEVHVLDEDGRDRIVASQLGSAGVLAPRSDGRLFFVATARGGGVAGVWLADVERNAARCLTNCELTTGTPLSEGFIPLPRDAESIHATPTHVEWDAADGTRRSVALAPSGSSRDGAIRAERQGGAP